MNLKEALFPTQKLDYDLTYRPTAYGGKVLSSMEEVDTLRLRNTEFLDNRIKCIVDYFDSIGEFNVSVSDLTRTQKKIEAQIGKRHDSDNICITIYLDSNTRASLPKAARIHIRYSTSESFELIAIKDAQGDFSSYLLETVTRLRSFYNYVDSKSKTVRLGVDQKGLFAQIYHSGLVLGLTVCFKYYIDEHLFKVVVKDEESDIATLYESFNRPDLNSYNFRVMGLLAAKDNVMSRYDEFCSELSETLYDLDEYMDSFN